MAVGHSGLEAEYEPDFDPPKEPDCSAGCQRHLLKHVQGLVILIGMVLGIGLGIGLRYVDISKDAILWIGMVGDVMIRLFRMMVIPLLVPSIISAISGMSRMLSARIILVSYGFFLLTNVLASLMAISLTFAIQPGTKGTLDDTKQIPGKQVNSLDLCADFLRNAFPPNIMTAAIQMEETTSSTRPENDPLHKYRIELNTEPNNQSNVHNTTLQTTESSALSTTDMTTSMHTNTTPFTPTDKPKLFKEVGKIEGTDLIGLIFFSCVMGLSASTPTRSGRPIRLLATSFAEIAQRVAQWFYWFCPIGLISHLTVTLLKAGDIPGALTSQGYFILTVAAAGAAHQLIVLPVLYAGIVRKNPLRFALRLYKPWLLLFGTSSSDVVMSAMMDSCRKEGIDRRIYQFGIPFGMGANHDGAAIYIATACLCVIQMSGGAPSVGSVFVIGLLATFMTLLIPRTPHGTLTLLTAILWILGLPTTYIPSFAAIEWLMSRVRACCDGMSHCYCASFTHKTCQSQLESYDIDQQIMYSMRSLNRFSRTGSDSGLVTVV